MNGKMNINLNNYEAYFLDYHEGRLSPSLVKELMGFVELHPELREEFESFEPITLQDAEGIKYDGKEALKKQLVVISSSNFDEYAIGCMEGTLTVSLQKELEIFIRQNPSYQKDFDLYSKTKLTPDRSIIFEDKPSLKKTRRRPAVFYYWSAAASVAVIIGVYLLLNNSGIPNGNNIVKHDKLGDSNTVAAHIVKPIDSAKITPTIPIVKTLKNSPFAIIKKQLPKQDTSEKRVQYNMQKDSSSIVVNKVTPYEHVVPVKKEIPVSTHSGNDTVVLNENSNDDGWQVIQRPKKKKKEKALVQLATITCRGLHAITGQHVELEKRYGSDTTTIIAYQLDLGNKKIGFPVKE